MQLFKQTTKPNRAKNNNMHISWKAGIKATYTCLQSQATRQQATIFCNQAKRQHAHMSQNQAKCTYLSKSNKKAACNYLSQPSDKVTYISQKQAKKQHAYSLKIKQQSIMHIVSSAYFSEHTTLFTLFCILTEVIHLY